MGAPILQSAKSICRFASLDSTCSISVRPDLPLKFSTRVIWDSVFLKGRTDESERGSRKNRIVKKISKKRQFDAEERRGDYVFIYGLEKRRFRAGRPSTAACRMCPRPERLKQPEDENASLPRSWPSRCWMAPALRELLSKTKMRPVWARRRRASSGHDGPVGTAGLLNGAAPRDGSGPASPPAARRHLELRTQLRDLANARRRFGYRRLFILLRQEGEPSGINRLYRLYREEGLTVRKRALRPGETPPRSQGVVSDRLLHDSTRWSVDFVHDQLAGRAVAVPRPDIRR